MFTKLAKTYFEAFSNKDINILTNMFSDEIYLRDWEIDTKGKRNVTLATENIFKSVDSIIAAPQNIYQVERTIISELEITINNDEVILVVDIIQFDQHNLIESIKAYKG